ncbi:MAG: DNA replication protein [Proteobacteria bacterium]|nr:DNA replication protein [Pseudomonadota bacterium]
MPSVPADGLPAPDVGASRARHLSLAERLIDTGAGLRRVTVDEAESPLAWLARRRGRDGRALIAAHQLLAGERLRADFTRGQMMPRTTSDWSGVASDRRGPSNTAADGTDATLAARQRVNAALDAVGPEFSGVLFDLCCFLKGLEDIERDRGWPARSAKVVLQLALDRLARHYGYLAEARGKAHAAVRTWLADDAAFHVE